MSIKWSITNSGCIYSKVNTTKWPSHIKIPSVINGIVVNEIGKFLFRHNLFIESIELPASVVKISAGAFEGCHNLKTVVFEKNSQLEDISSFAFSDCHLEAFPFEKLSKLRILGTQAFSANSYLTKVDLSNTDIEEIDEECFVDSAISEIKFSKKLEFIGSESFSNTRLTEINFFDISEAETVTVYSGAFKSCPYLGKIIFSDMDTYIEDEVFYNCSNLKSVTIPTNVSLGDYSFAQCDNLETVVFEKGKPLVDYLPQGVFWHCVDLENVQINTAFTTICREAFMECRSLKNITFPETLNKIKYRAFCYCSNISSVDLTNRNIQKIENNSFAMTNFDINGFKMDFTSGTEFETDVFEGNDNISLKDIRDKYPFCNIVW